VPTASFLRRLAVPAGVVLAIAVGCLLYRRHHLSELVERSATIENVYAPLALEIEYQGNVVGRVIEPKGSFHFGVPRRVFTQQLADGLSFFVEAPCGRRRLDYVSAAGTTDENLGFVTIPLYAAGPPYASDLTVRNRSSALIVDNRSLPAGKVSAGQLSLDVAADHASTFTLFLGSCPPLFELRWQGQDIGKAVRSVLVDPSGTRCYALRNVKYSAPWLGSQGNEVKHLAPAKVHPLDRPVDYLFESAPHSIQSVTISQDKDELTEEACP
jgi:hypothetical protein